MPEHAQRVEGDESYTSTRANAWRTPSTRAGPRARGRGSREAAQVVRKNLDVLHVALLVHCGAAPLVGMAIHALAGHGRMDRCDWALHGGLLRPAFPGSQDKEDGR
jgi:hypothetical protein